MRKALATATATVDRLLHHAHLCQTSGESVRLSQALTGQRGESFDLTAERPVATPLGAGPLPPPFSSIVRQRSHLASATVQVGVSLESPLTG